MVIEFNLFLLYVKNKKLNVFLILLFPKKHSFAKMGEVKREYYDGKLWVEWFEINGKKEGEEKSYYSNGQFRHIRNYVNDVEEGEYKGNASLVYRKLQPR